MIIEHVHLNIKPNQSQNFEQAFQQAKDVIAPMHGLNSVQLIKHVDDEQRYVMIIVWDTLEDHVEGFRKSEAYQEWRALLHHFYDPRPKLEYYQPCISLKVKEA